MVSDNLKIICINKNFDRYFRANFLECVDFVCKFENEKENYFNQINDDYGKFTAGILLKLGDFYKKEIVEMQIGIPKEGEEEEEEDKE